ncbi:uncharacterized protein BDR25DRAFT_319475 [Lindgomyces ingoldianus]|uniref:Uncharacterized protein n=1 Tax=Lindgomyces ingoldianus TaxID=673940 RepID=A0ACB6QAW5_9PLEO|nr:uncharacterized protein BDR25DRAFT_319475 [Lindgomyces ingoldianus]KAF2464057.1 hypothetical protein BDR25DRAFT_319475 [Lindgomyces ingoldianus]
MFLERLPQKIRASSGCTFQISLWRGLPIPNPSRTPLFFLDTPSRRKIWRSFFDMLTEDGINVDFEDLVSHLDELAEHEMNNRQIRNVFATAWQLALFERQRLEWGHIEQSLAMAEQFNGQLKELQRVSDTDRVRDKKVRWQRHSAIPHSFIFIPIVEIFKDRDC